ncbi:MAG: outer membrane protein assembly factor BamE [Candidatus Puniceispirillaceae bacterium]
MTRPSRTKLAPTKLAHTKLGQSRVLSFALFCLASLSLATVSACGDRVSSHGHVINESELKQITIGTTTKADIVQLLGQPSFAGAFDTQKLYYSSQVMLQPVASVKQTQRRVIYIFTLNKNNVLEAVDLVDKDDGLTIAHIDDKTPTPGDRFGILDQVFTNIRRQ